MLTPWHAEEEVLWEMCGRPLDAYSMKICAAIRLAQPIVVSSARKEKGRYAAQFSSIVTPPIDVSRLRGFLVGHTWSENDPGQLLQAAQVKHHLGVSDIAWQSFSESVPYLNVPLPLVRLIAHDRWHHLLFTASADQKFKRSKTAGARLYKRKL